LGKPNLLFHINNFDFLNTTHSFHCLKKERKTRYLKNHTFNIKNIIIFIEKIITTYASKTRTDELCKGKPSLEGDFIIQI
jgi:hypothetical protein